VTYKPDYGLRLRADGFSREIIHTFYDFRLYSLTVLAPDRFSTMVEYPYEGQLHALSLDFNLDQLKKILLNAPQSVKETISRKLQVDPITPRTIDFEGSVSFRVKARLGEIQANEKESFVPLVALEIF